jgi:hypothetical protein
MTASFQRRAAGLFAIVSLLGCTAKGRAKVGTAEPSRVSDDNTSAWGEGTTSSPPSPSPSSGTVEATAPEAAPSASAAVPATPRPGCALVCNVANKGRVAAADEARLTTSLAEVTNALHQCLPDASPSMTLRFDSTGVLTGFGVDHAADDDRGGDASCIDSINRRTPKVAYPGPATVRCVERCAR